MTNKTAYYRPIQYLGSKTRVVDTIVSECKKLYTPGEYVVDLFSGSSIVSQSLYKNGMHVIRYSFLVHQPVLTVRHPHSSNIPIHYVNHEG